MSRFAPIPAAKTHQRSLEDEASAGFGSEPSPRFPGLFFLHPEGIGRCPPSGWTCSTGCETFVRMCIVKSCTQPVGESPTRVNGATGDAFSYCYPRKLSRYRVLGVASRSAGLSVDRTCADRSALSGVKVSSPENNLRGGRPSMQQPQLMQHLNHHNLKRAFRSLAGNKGAGIDKVDSVAFFAENPLPKSLMRKSRKSGSARSAGLQRPVFT